MNSPKSTDPRPSFSAGLARVIERERPSYQKLAEKVAEDERLALARSEVLQETSPNMVDAAVQSNQAVDLLQTAQPPTEVREETVLKPDKVDKATITDEDWLVLLPNGEDIADLADDIEQMMFESIEDFATLPPNDTDNSLSSEVNVMTENTSPGKPDDRNKEQKEQKEEGSNDTDNSLSSEVNVMTENTSPGKPDGRNKEQKEQKEEGFNDTVNSLFSEVNVITENTSLDEPDDRNTEQKEQKEEGFKDVVLGRSMSSETRHKDLKVHWAMLVDEEKLPVKQRPESFAQEGLIPTFRTARVSKLRLPYLERCNAVLARSNEHMVILEAEPSEEQTATKTDNVEQTQSGQTSEGLPNYKVAQNSTESTSASHREIENHADGNCSSL